jgi:hypothetical protein
MSRNSMCRRLWLTSPACWKARVTIENAFAPDADHWCQEFPRQWQSFALAQIPRAQQQQP